MKILKKLFIFLVVIIILAAVVAFFLPKTVHVERSTVVQASPCHVHALLHSYRGFNRWSPWAKLDPDTKYTFSGPDWGVGAKMAWTSEDPSVGVGSQIITSDTPCSEVLVTLDFGDQGTAEAFYRIEADGTGSKVSWGFDTDLGMNPIARYMGLMLDKWIGADYEKGLASFKQLAESQPQVDFTGLDAEVVETKAIPYAYLAGEGNMEEPDQIGVVIGTAYGRILAAIGVASLEQASPPILINTKMEGSVFGFDAGIPLTGKPDAALSDDVQIGELHEGKAVRFVHTGAYHNLPQTYEKVDAFLAVYNYEPVGNSWDEYINDPGNTPEEELITHIFFPIE